MILISYGDKSTKNRNGQNAKIKQTTKEKQREYYLIDYLFEANMFLINLFQFTDLGLREPRLEGEEYLSIVDEFMEAVHARWPKAIVQVKLL